MIRPTTARLLNAWPIDLPTAEALATAIRQGINTALTDIEDIEIPQLSEMWSDLEVCWAELLSIRGDIERLEKEIGN